MSLSRKILEEYRVTDVPKKRVVNNIVVKPLPKNTNKSKLQSTIFKEPFTTTGIFSKRGSGKTTLLYSILLDAISTYPLMEIRPERKEKMARVQFGGAESSDEEDEPKRFRNLTVFIFAKNLKRDPNYKWILKLLKNANVSYMTETSTFHKGNKNLNLVNGLMRYIEGRSELDDDEGLYNSFSNMIVNENNGDDEIQAKMDKNLDYPDEDRDFIIIVDDLAKQLKANPTFDEWLKNSRHTIRNFILCSQSPKDCSPDMLDQMDNIILFRKMPPERLIHIHECCGMDIKFGKLLKLYKEVTKKKYSFLFIDNKNDEYYDNFNELFD